MREPGWHLPFLKYYIVKGQKDNSFNLDFSRGKYYKMLYEEQRFPIIKGKKEENNLKIVSMRVGEKSNLIFTWCSLEMISNSNEKIRGSSSSSIK